MRDQHLLNELTMPIFSFSNLVDVDEAAESLGWKDRSWQGLSHKLTGGPMCNRAKSLPRGTRPSYVAILHERIRVSLLYEFARRNGGSLHEPLEKGRKHGITNSKRKEHRDNDQARDWSNGRRQRTK